MRYTYKQLAVALIDACEEKGTDISEVTRAFVDMMAQNQDLARIRGVMESIETVWKQRNGAATITIETAHPLTVALQKKLQAISSGAEIKERIDQTLIGGARIRIDDRIIDGSLSGRLTQIQQSMNAS